MRKILLTVLMLALAAGATYLIVNRNAEWQGIDETVVAKYATEAGRPPRSAFLDTDRGDLMLFYFLIAGAIGGFVAGYCFRELFPPGSKPTAS